ncbi:MAG TPA: recombinase family protein [Trebonia sp.]|nr:recombinase family protein [Trebonia sp.]
MIFVASWALSSRLYGLAQRFCPSNIVIRRVHTRTGIKWGPLIGAAGVIVYGLLLVATGTIVRDGGPGSATRRRCCCVTGNAPTPPTCGCPCTGRAGVMSAEDWSPSDLPAVSYIRVAPTTTDEAAREVERQRARIALAAQRLGLRMADEFVDVGYSG